MFVSSKIFMEMVECLVRVEQKLKMLEKNVMQGGLPVKEESQEIQDKAGKLYDEFMNGVPDETGKVRWTDGTR